MKYKINKRPQYGLQIKYLAMILTKKELKELIDKYVEAKIKYWTEE